MNNLSWLIYFAEVIPQVSSYLFGIGIATLVGWVGLNLVNTINKAVHNDMAVIYDRLDPDGRGLKKEHSFLFPWLVVVPLVLMGVSSAIPSRQTILLIAGSELGQKVYEQPGTQEILGDVKDIITKELKRIKEGKR